MGLKDFRQGWRVVLLSDAEVTSWVTTNFPGKTLSVLDHFQAGEVSDVEMPAAVIGAAELTEERVAVGGRWAVKVAELPFVVLWRNSDPAAALAQYEDLADVLSRAVLRNRTMGGVADVGLVNVSLDFANQPQQALSGLLRGEYRVSI